MIAHRLAFILLTASLSNASAEDQLSYNADIRPILSDKCFLCHGPDKGNREAGLRLDTEEGAFAELKKSSGKFAIVPGSLEKSEAWRRMILPSDHDDVMPTKKSNLSLTVKEKEKISQWIKQGAKYEPHWSFVNLPEKVEIPKIKDPKWARNPIDHFVAAKLEATHLAPSPEAAPLRWLRRVTFDLTGLPPTLEEISAFEKDVASMREKAYAKKVDALLSTTEYAENMAIPWLDASRYADTWGYHVDDDFTAWPYRDWVVKALKNDMPYKQFVIENLAGDLLPNATREQKLATVFNRLNRMTNEGGSSSEEFFADGVSDRVNTMGTAFLGLTMECSKCHDHKYDPITAKDYFQLYAFFNSINEVGLYNHKNITPPPSLLLPSKKQETNLKKHQQEAAQLKKKLAELRGSQRTQFQAWKKQTLHPAPPQAPANQPIPADKPKDKAASLIQLPDGTTTVLQPVEEKKAPAVQTEPTPAQPAPAPKPVKIKLADQTSYFDFDKGAKKPLNSRIKKDGKDLVGKLKLAKFVEGPKGYGTAIALDGDYGFSVEKFFVTDRYTPFSVSLWLKDTLRVKEESTILHRAFGTEIGYNGVLLTIEDGYLSARVQRNWPGNGIGIRSIERLPQNQWHHLTWTYDASSTAAGLKLFLNGKPLKTKITGDHIYKSASIKTFRPGHFLVGAIFRGRGFMGGHVDELKTFNRALTPVEVKHVAGIKEINKSLVENPDEELYAYYLANHHPEYRKTLTAFAMAQRKIVNTEDHFIEVPVMEDMAEPRPAHIHKRGEYNNLGEPVQRDTLGFLLPFPKDAPRNRLGLAQWLTLPNHPLTSRVYVNRIWQQFFGNGLVGTTENFGLQGDLPTHPQLLDWLSRDFINQGWSTKTLVKQIVLSATYRQESKLTPELESSDIDNKLLARGPAHRLSGEQIRDAALASSGLLNKKVGGGPVRPFDPITNRKPNIHHTHRRSLYSYWRRTKPQNNMIIFDKPSLEVCSVKRNRTNSPAQALVSLNDPQFVEAARHLATTTIQKFQDDSTRIKTAWKKVTSREPNKTELRILKEILADSRSYFAERKEQSKKLLKVGFKPAPKEIDTQEAAAFTVLCQAIYNSDAAIWKR